MTGTVRFLVTLETDPTRYHGEAGGRPLMPDSSACEQVLAHVAADLERLFPETVQCHLALAGALLDQSQVLRPGFPAHAALEALLGARRSREAAPGRFAVTAKNGRMSDPRLQPDRLIPPGAMQNLAVVLQGPEPLCAELTEAMEHRFLEAGQLSAHSAKGIEAQFGVAVKHARFMTLTDLQAMLRLQFEHFGFLPLWELLDAALDGGAPSVEVYGAQGQRFEYGDGAVHARFETFDYWAREGAGRDVPAEGRELEQAYYDWTREYRQFMATLQAHAVPVVQYLPGGERAQSSFLAEPSPLSPPVDAAGVTEHCCDELGVVAVTVVSEGRQQNYYPLVPAGLNDLLDYISAQGLGAGGMAYPCRIVHDAQERRLAADRLPGAHG